MAATLFLVIGLSVTGFVWLLALQMRGLVYHVLILNAEEAYPDMDPDELNVKTKAAINGEAGPIRDVLLDTSAQALGHLLLARKVMRYAPIAVLLIALIWRFVLGGGS